MMFRLIFIFIILGLGLFVGTQYSDQQGYVLITIADTTTEMSVTTLVIFIVAILAGLFLLESIIKRSLNATSATWNWFNVRKLKRARRYTNEGIIKLLEGDWSGAEKKVTRWANHHDMPILCYLIASEAAQGMGDDAKREKYLTLALEQDKESLAVEITRIRQLVRNKEFAEANNALEKIKGRYPNNTIIMNLLKKTYLNLKLWSSLDELLPKLKKAKVISNNEFEQLFYQTQLGEMEDVGKKSGIEGLLAYWSSLPKKIKKDENIIKLMLKQLLTYNGDTEAYVLLRDNLKQSPSEELVPFITHIQLPDIHPAIILLEGIVEKHPENAEAFSALGELYSREHKWPEAQQAFESALKKRVSISDYSRLADVLEQQGYKRAAGDVSRKALTLIDTERTT